MLFVKVKVDVVIVAVKTVEHEQILDFLVVVGGVTEQLFRRVWRSRLCAHLRRRHVKQRFKLSSSLLVEGVLNTGIHEPFVQLRSDLLRLEVVDVVWSL